MRIGSSIILRYGKAVQSYNWKLLKPFGSLKSILKHLDDFQCDEIAILRHVREKNEMHDFIRDIEQLKKLSSSSPISFGGGIREKSHLASLNDVPIERIIFSSVFLSEQEDLLLEAIARFGRQAILALLPVYFSKNEKYIFHLATGKKLAFEKINFNFIEKYANEVILYDVKNEGEKDSFNFDIIKELPLEPAKLVVTGGIGSSCIKRSAELKLASVLIDNKTLHTEYSIEKFRGLI